MSKNPFAADAVPEEKIKRNAYDLSRQNLFSTHFGRLTPCFLEEVLPGDTFEINSSLVIQGMPTVFPLQTRCRVSVEFYYGRNRCVYDNFEDFIFKTKDGLEQPWLRLNTMRAKKMISTNSLGDLFGLPTSVGTDTVISLPWLTFDYLLTYSDNSLYYNASASAVRSHYLGLFADPRNWYNFYRLSAPIPKDSLDSAGFYFVSKPISSIPDDTTIQFVVPYTYITPYTNNDNWVCGLLIDNSTYIFFEASRSYDSNLYTFVLPDEFNSALNSYFNGGHSVRVILGSISTRSVDSVVYSDLTINPLNTSLYFNWLPSVATRSVISPTSVPVDFPVSKITDSTDDSVISNNPFIGNEPSIKVNALPFRHYEMICNYYYRNDKNNPYILDGQAQYNEFIPTHAGGADDNEYLFHYKNWELDRFTSATQSPQFGEAPLVGLTFSGSDTAKIEFQDADNPDTKYYAEVGIDGERISTIEDFSQDIPSSNLRRLQEMIHYGISINDLRVTNSFHRFLENVLRRGLRYRNQLKSHFGVSVDYPDIDIPQYIGGYSGELNVSKVTSTAQTSEANLGDFNGQLSGIISSQHKIKHYCTEHGFIIGIMSITPIPVYSQSCNKVMIKSNPFDYYFPEFGKIGHVPIHYSEVMPLQTGVGQSVDDVFGYQRAWYDYMRSYDQAHGFFRTNLKDFVLQRLFAERPELVEDFTVIKPEQLTDVFVTRNIADAYNVDDKFLCNFYVHCIVARQIPRFGTPSLE